MAVARFAVVFLAAVFFVVFLVVLRVPRFLAGPFARYASSDTSTALPKLSEGQELAFNEVDREKAAHVTSPPPRYTEASLVKTLEENGVGRPSTYASTIGVIIERGYVRRAGQALIPSWQAFAVVRLLEKSGSLAGKSTQ